MAAEPKPGKLRDLKVKFVSLVTRGANQGSRKLLHKAAPSALAGAWGGLAKALGYDAAPAPSTPEPRSVGQLLALSEFWDGWWVLRDSLELSLSEIMGSDAADKPGRVRQTVAEFLAGVQSLADSVTGDVDSAAIIGKIDAALSSVTDSAALSKALDAAEETSGAPARSPPPTSNTPPAPAGEGEAPMDTAEEMIEKMPPEQRDAFKAYIKGCIDKALAEAAAAAKAEAPAVAKALEVPAHVQKMIDDATSRTVELKKQLDVERDLRIDREVTSDVEKIGAIPGIALADAVVLLKAARAGQPVGEDKLRAMFSATADILRASAILKTLGSSGVPDGASAEGKVVAMAKSLREKDSALTPEGAMARVASLAPELYAEWITEDAARAS